MNLQALHRGGCTVGAAAGKFICSRFGLGLAKPFSSSSTRMSKARQAVNLKALGWVELKAFLDSFDTVLTDCDGVLWVGNTALPHSAEVINSFQKLGKRVFYVTNNSTKTREEFAQKCKQLNFEASEDQLFCTSNLAATYLKNLAFKKKVYLIGSTGISRELDKVGIAHVGLGPDPMPAAESAGMELGFERDPEVGAVLVGFDVHISYPKMTKAASYLNDREVHFVATNTDTRFPDVDNVIRPGTGSIVNCIETCSERRAVVMGKPEPYIADVLRQQCQVDPARTLMIGDRDKSDILLAARCGFQSLLVLSGVTSLEDVRNYEASYQQDQQDLVPDFYIDTLGDLYPHLQRCLDK